MPLTADQSATLRAAVAADPALAALPAGGDSSFTIALAFNAPAAPAYTVWRTRVSIDEIGDAINSSELVGLTSLNLQRLQTISDYSSGSIDPSRVDRRDAFAQVFNGAGGSITRPALLALWKRRATRAERLYASGTGSDAVPALMTFEGELSSADVQNAMGW